MNDLRGRNEKAGKIPLSQRKQELKEFTPEQEAVGWHLEVYIMQVIWDSISDYLCSISSGLKVLFT